MEKAMLLMGQAIFHYRDNLDLQNLIDYIQKKVLNHFVLFSYFWRQLFKLMFKFQNHPANNP